MKKKGLKKSVIVLLCVLLTSFIAIGCGKTSINQITINNTETTLGIGKTLTLDIAVAPNGVAKDLKYSSSDDSIATVENGVVNGVKEGAVTITVSSAQDATIKDTINLEVVVEVIKVTLTLTPNVIYSNSTAQASVSIYPATATIKTVSYSSSNTAVATIDEKTGLITAVAEGETEITAKSSNGKEGKDTLTVEKMTNVADYTTSTVEGGLSITGYKGSDTTIIIPDEINGKKVVSIASDAFKKNRKITAVTIGKNVKEICDNAFYDDVAWQSPLASVKFVSGNALEKIGVSAFENNTNIAVFDLPKTVKTLGNKAFYAVQAIKSFTIPATVTSIGDSLFEWGSLETLTFDAGSKLESIGASAFKFNKIKEVKIPNTVTSIGVAAFSSIAQLEKFEFESGNKIATISPYMLSMNTNITSLVLPATVTTIGNNAFEGCSAIVELSLSENVATIGSSAFKSWVATQKIVVPYVLGNTPSGWNAGYLDECAAKVQYLPAPLCDLAYTLSEGNATITGFGAGFDGAKASLTIPDMIPNTQFKIVAIGSNAFKDQIEILSVTLGQFVTSIGESAFEGCTSLSSVDLGKVITIGNKAFKGANFTSIVIPKETKTIGEYAFYGVGETSKLIEFAFVADAQIVELKKGSIANNPKLKAFKFPSTLTTLGDEVFAYNTGIMKLEIPTTITKIGAYAFTGWTKSQAVMSTKAKADTSSWTDWNMDKDLSAVTKTLSNANIYLGVTSATEGGYEYLYSVNEDNTSCTIVELVTKAWQATISIPASLNGKTVTDIGACAFYNNATLCRVTIPDCIKTIGAWAFGFDKAGSVVIELNLNVETSSLTYIGDYAFCKAPIGKLNLPKKLETIGKGAFTEGNSDRSVLTIPKSVKVIGDSAFEWSAFAGLVFESESCLEKIGHSAFKNMGDALTGEIVIPSTVTEIGGYAFAGATAVGKITIPTSVIKLGPAVFTGWTAQQTIVVSFTQALIPVGWETGWNTNWDGTALLATIQYAN